MIRSATALFFALATPFVFAAAAPDWKPEKAIEILVGVTPGGPADTSARMIQKILQDKRMAGVPVSVCGEMAGDVRLTRLLLGMGLTQFSMHPSQLLDVKELMLKTEFENAQKLVKKMARSFDIDKIDALMRQLHAD